MDIYVARPGLRFALGQSGRRMLLVVGLNPSRATPTQPDPTLTKVRRITQQAGFDGFVLVNLCPLRCLHPDELPWQLPDPWLQENGDLIRDLVGRWSPAGIWAAWGNGIVQRPYLSESLQTLWPDLSDRAWWCYGPLTRQGHPRHPVRAGYGLALLPFDAARYVQRLKTPSGSNAVQTHPRECAALGSAGFGGDRALGSGLPTGWLPPATAPARLGQRRSAMSGNC
ncbi:MAG: DUF1643 domain-containing protein [Gloeomargarita sp. SKYBB_i_bin120]|nr:DUF1643 domain-containing protein [Gloeomargarita sp. SKYB120]MDW8178927.1 DUF1643 domain-containing protein [Gloeomargarita sp. SKYBB_i_bin120]